MAQGSAKLASKKVVSTSKQAKLKAKKQQPRKGAPLKLPNSTFRNEALDDRALSRAIAKASEQRVAAKLIQDGGRISLSDVMQKGKELNREKKRDQVKKKLGRVAEKLKVLKSKVEDQN